MGNPTTSLVNGRRVSFLSFGMCPRAWQAPCSWTCRCFALAEFYDLTQLSYFARSKFRSRPTFPTALVVEI